jgi:hypothetical protein
MKQYHNPKVTIVEPLMEHIFNKFGDVQVFSYLDDD